MAQINVADSKQKVSRHVRHPAALESFSFVFANALSFHKNKLESRSALRGFTAIEMIGVLAVIAMLAAAIMPNVIRKVDRAALVRETSDLSTMANGLVQSIRREKTIPATNAIAQTIARY